MLELAPFPVGAFWFGPETASLAEHGGPTPESQREVFASLGPWLLAEIPGGRDELRERVVPRYRDIVDELEPVERTPALTYGSHTTYARGGTQVDVQSTVISVRDGDGQPEP